MDQFLEGIISMNNSADNADDHTDSDDPGGSDNFNDSIYITKQFSIVRVGGRSQNKEIDEYNIKKFGVRKAKVPRRIYLQTNDLKNRIERAGMDLDYKFQIIQHEINPPLRAIIEFIAPIHIAQLSSLVKGHGHGYAKVENGLNLWLSCEDLAKPGVKGTMNAKNIDVRYQNEDDGDMNVAIPINLKGKASITNTRDKLIKQE